MIGARSSGEAQVFVDKEVVAHSTAVLSRRESTLLV
jgi:hypothetical protein